jgi:hypothetical protein
MEGYRGRAIFFPMAQQPNAGHGLHILDDVS